MKKAILVVSDETDVTEELKEYAEQFAKKHGAKMVGAMVYPDGLPMCEPEVMLQSIKVAKPDVVIASDPDFLIEEIIKENHIGKGLKAEGIKLYDLHLGMELDKVMDTLPQELLDELHKTIREAKSNSMKQSQKENYLIISKTEDSDEVEHFTNGIASRGKLSKVCQIEMNEFYPEMEKFIQEVVDSNSINNIVVYSTYNSPDLENYMSKLSNDGIKVVNKDQQDLELDMCPKFSGMMMN
ncbi:hypothetical protein [Anaerorhabdus sp.]|uniref:hypothetical protein n=1 Tax=Anaerorhabdus sp. TaxID=1872524 RepID=UPI002FCA6ED7